MKKMIFIKMTKPVLLVFVLLFSVKAFSDNGQRSIFDLMQHKEVLDLTLETDLKSLKENRRSDDSYKAHVSFKDETGKKQEWDLKVKARGAFRRIHCSDMPPLKLNFKKSDLKAAGLADFDDFKLVPYCMGSEDAAREALLREYLMYRLFNTITDQSFRVQLLRITYKDVSSGMKSQQWAFLIEDAAQLRARIGAEKADESNAFNLPADSFDGDYLKLVAVFQYMTGNTDWGTGTGKNLKFMRKEGKLVAIPYDFDYSGLVNAPYYAPDADYGLTSREQRIFLGFPEYISELKPATDLILSKRSAMEELIKNFKLLTASSRRDMLSYLTTYFDNPAIAKAGEKTFGKTASTRELQD